MRLRPVDVGSRLGRYELIEELGAGGMATVYRAYDSGLRRDVALKVLFPHLGKRREIVARFEREARAAAALDHPNIVRVHDVGGGLAGDATADGAVDPPYIVLELVRGQSLQDFVGAHPGPVLAEVAACVGVVMCAALSRAHAAGIVHRDVKPANILVTEEGRLALADFGVARIEDEDSSLVTRTGALLGTPAFMSPEQAAGSAPDARSDIYSLGATLYRLATGVQPFTGPTARVVAAIASGELRPPLARNPAMGAELSRVIARMMAREPADRFQTCEQAAEALSGLVREAGLGEAEDELCVFFADPAAHAAERTPRVVAALVSHARQATRAGQATRAMALADRVAALAPGSPAEAEVLALVKELGQGRRRGVVVAAATLGLVALGLVALGWRSLPGAAPRGGSEPVLAEAGEVEAGVHEAGEAEPGVREAGVREGGEAEPGVRDSVLAEPGVRDGSGDTALAPAALVPASAPEAAASSGPGDRERRVPRARRPEQRARPVALLPDAGAPASSPAPPGALPAAAPTPAPASSPPAEATPASSPPAQAAPASSPPAQAAPAQATLTLDIRPWCDVRISGVDHGRAQRDRRITVPAGTHEIVCTQGPGRAEWRRTVTLAPGQHLALSGSVLRPVQVTLALRAGDRVVIQGASHDNGATLALQPGRYRMDVMAGSARIAGAWVSIPAVAACTVREQPALDCYP